MPCHSSRGSTRTAASAHVCPRVVVGSPESRGCAWDNPRCSLQELSCPQARGRRQGQVVSAQDLPAPAEPHRGPDQTEPLQELATAGSCYGEGDARPAKSSSGGRAASHRSQPSQQRPAGAAKQLWSYAVQGHGGGCGSSCPVQAQGRGSGALPGPTATVPAGRLSARNAPSGRQRGTARHSQQTLRARRLVEKQGAGSLDNPLPSA